METISCVSASEFERILKAQQDLNERFQYLENHAKKHETYCVIIWVIYMLVFGWYAIRDMKQKT